MIVATSAGRTRMLAARALPSIYRQARVHPAEVRIVVVDDNTDPDEFDHLEAAIGELRTTLHLDRDAFATTLTRNRRTRGNSGTGAWNTGLALLEADPHPPTWVAILDDDDEFLPEHLASCVAAARERDIGVFERLEWVRTGGGEPRPFTLQDLTPEAFFIGNPGVQGSNLFVRLSAMLEIGGFDETLASATDRDLMIRLLRHAGATGRTVSALPSVGVRYFDHDRPRVNTDPARKRAGLDRLYAKYTCDFSPQQLAASLDRARRLFGYEPQ